MQLTTLWRTPKGSLSKLSTTASCHQPWLRLLRQENQQNQQQKVKSSKANGSATNAKAFCWSWHDRGCAMFLLNLLNGWLGSQISFFNNPTCNSLSMFYQSYQVSYCDMSIYHDIIWHITWYAAITGQAALLAMSRPLRPVAKAAQESMAGAVTCSGHDPTDAP